jgi:hypothetical protein
MQWLDQHSISYLIPERGGSCVRKTGQALTRLLTFSWIIAGADPAADRQFKLVTVQQWDRHDGPQAAYTSPPPKRGALRTQYGPLYSPKQDNTFSNYTPLHS